MMQLPLTDPVAIFVFFLILVGFVFYISELPGLRRFFHFVPPLVFCYFLPMIATTVGITPESSPLYSWCNRHLLPAVLLLLLISADIGAIMRLGPKALGVMLAGTAGVVIGAVLGFFLFQDKLGPEGAHNLGALVGSWTGGSANMFAVKAALDIPDQAFSPMLIVDTVFVYSWMGIVIALAAFQGTFDRIFRADTAAIKAIEAKVTEAAQTAVPITTRAFLGILALGFGGGYLCLMGGDALNARFIAPLAEQWPESKTFSGFTLTIILVTALGIILSFTPVRKLEGAGASKIGYALLFLLLPTFGAQANLREIDRAAWYGAVACVMVACHVTFIFLAMVVLKAPLFFGAVGSQANMGGPASASVVATTYQPALAPVGILLGVLGGIIGTYMGLIAATLCSMIAGG